LTPAGTHVLIDCYGSKDPGDDALNILRRVAALAGCSVIDEVEHVFPGGGRTALVLLSQSHASIHTWPEHRYVSFDLYSCRALSSEEVALVSSYVKGEFKPEREAVRTVERGNAF
jgi:S-adenosylmethionine/arginine decarboxylase-like enzyme